MRSWRIPRPEPSYSCTLRPVRLPRHPQVRRWLNDLDDASRTRVDEALLYLEEHGRAAALPDVRHRIQTSSHYPHMSEVRVDVGKSHAYRILVVFGPRSVPILVAAGDKAGIGNAWYDANVPIADERFEQFMAAFRRQQSEMQLERGRLLSRKERHGERAANRLGPLRPE